MGQNPGITINIRLLQYGAEPWYNDQHSFATVWGINIRLLQYEAEPRYNDQHSFATVWGRTPV